MNEKPKWRVCFEERNCDVKRAFLYASNYYDIWLLDVATQKLTDFCTVTSSDLPVGDHIRLIREPYVELLTEAGFAVPTGEVFESTEHGRLHFCEVPEIEPTSLVGRHRQKEQGSQIETGERERDAGDEIEV